MKKTLTRYDIARALLQDGDAAWTIGGAFAMAEHLQQYEEETGEEMEIDIIAIRCNFSEYSSLQDWAAEYFYNSKQSGESIGIDLEMDGQNWDEDELKDAIRIYIQKNGELIEFYGGIIVSTF